MNNIFCRGYFLILAAVMLSLNLTACSISSPPIKYYSLLDASRIPVVRSNSSLIVSVGPVTLTETLKNSHIVTGGSTGVYFRSEYHRWSGEVDVDFARALAEQLAYDLGSDRIVVFPGNGQIKPDCQVLINVIAMDGDLGKNAELTVRWTLIDRHGKKAPAFRRSHFSEQPADEGYTSWVLSQRDNLNHLGKVIAKSIKEQFILE